MIEPLSCHPEERIAQLEEKVAQAYQVIATLLPYHGQASVLDYFGRLVFDPEFLPWPGDNARARTAEP